MKVVVKKYSTTTAPETTVEATTPVEATTVTNPTTAPSSIVIDGELYNVGKSSFHVDAEAGDHSKGSYDYIDIGDGVWYCPEINKTLIGFEVHMSYEPMVPVVVTKEFDWKEFFSLNVTPYGTFDGFVWRGDLRNKIGNEISLMVNFLYEEDDRTARYDSMYRADLRIIKSLDDLFKEFPRFYNWIQLSGIRASNPWLD